MVPSLRVLPMTVDLNRADGNCCKLIPIDRVRILVCAYVCHYVSIYLLITLDQNLWFEYGCIRYHTT